MIGNNPRRPVSSTDSAMSPSEAQHAILFSDIVGSSLLYQQLGNVKAEEKIRFVIDTLVATAEKYSGTLVKTLGDEVMCYFQTLSDAAEAAVEMNNLVQNDRIELRSGVSYGSVVHRDHDVFGDAVNNAAYLTKVARPKEVLIDESALQACNSVLEHIELIAEIPLKGAPRSCKIYRINWEQQLTQSMSATIVGGGRLPNYDEGAALVLNYREARYTVNSSLPFFVIGREAQHVNCEIRNRKISRRHCSILFRQGKFVLEDHSTNGTYVHQEGVGTTYVHRETFTLLGQGILRLGQNSDLCALHYEFVKAASSKQKPALTTLELA